LLRLLPRDRVRPSCDGRKRSCAVHSCIALAKSTSLPRRRCRRWAENNEGYYEMTISRRALAPLALIGLLTAAAGCTSLGEEDRNMLADTRNAAMEAKQEASAARQEAAAARRTAEQAAMSAQQAQQDAAAAAQRAEEANERANRMFQRSLRK